MKDDKDLMEPEIHPAEDPKDCGFYETGNTRPPKNHHRLVAVLLVIYIVLGGMFGILTMLNVSLASRRSLRHALSFTPKGPGTSAEGERGSLQIDVTEPTAAAAGEGPRVKLSDTPAAVANVPQEGGLSLQEIYEKAAPSVVSVTAATDSGTQSGSGILLSSDGYLITNCHVVEGGTSLAVTLYDGQEFTACLVGADSVSDLAVLKIEATGLTPAEFGSSDNARVGDSVTVIGSPLGKELPGTMTNGIISAINRNVVIGGNTMSLMQTNAALNSGNSGGPLLNCYGQVIGIVTAKIGDYASTAGTEGLGFAIPMSSAQEIINLLMEKGYVPGRPSLGLEYRELPALYSIYYDLPQGLWVDTVKEGSSAEQAGICQGDILTAIDGTAVSTASQVQAKIGSFQVGDTVTVTVWRRGVSRELEIVLTDAGA